MRLLVESCMTTTDGLKQKWKRSPSILKCGCFFANQYSMLSTSLLVNELSKDVAAKTLTDPRAKTRTRWERCPIKIVVFSAGPHLKVSLHAMPVLSDSILWTQAQTLVYWIELAWALFKVRRNKLHSAHTQLKRTSFMRSAACKASISSSFSSSWRRKHRNISSMNMWRVSLQPKSKYIANTPRIHGKQTQWYTQPALQHPATAIRSCEYTLSCCASG